MKIQPSKIESFLKAPPDGIVVVLAYGPDQGAVGEAADRLVKHVAEDPKDPFRVADLGVADLKDDPARLLDEMQAMALTGGRRAVRLRNAGDAQAGAVQPVVDGVAPGGNLLIVEAGELGPRSALRKLAEGSDTAAALACYMGDAEAIGGLARRMMGEAKLSLDPDAERLLGERLSGDRQLARREIEKLILYAGNVPRVDGEMVRAAIGDSAAEGLDVLTDAVAGGDLATADRLTAKLLQEDVAPIAILRALLRHFDQLRQIGERMGAGQSFDQVAGAMRLFYKRKDAVRAQSRTWTPAACRTVLSRLNEAEAQLKTSGPPPAALISRVALQTAHQARQAGRRRSAR